MKIAVMGTGYVGLVTGACFAETGNHVACLDIDEAKIAKLKNGEIPFYEPGLADLVKANHDGGRLLFTTDAKEALGEAEICFICVGTPSAEDGSANLNYVFSAAETAAKNLKKHAIVTVKSTVPIGTGTKVRNIIHKAGREDITTASNPEFLREGSAVQDCMLPDRVVIGTDHPKVVDKFRTLYSPFLRTGNPLFVMDICSAEMTKYAANALLAMRISFMNEVSMLCDEVGADVTMVRQGIGSDKRIGLQYLFPSVGFGGSCFPKDVRALASLSREYGLEAPLLRSTLSVNEMQKDKFAKRIIDHFGGEKGIRGKRIAVWGLSFKAKTDDIRESPALTIIDRLLEKNAEVVVYDPVANANVEAEYGDKLKYRSNAYNAAEEADALCVMTEWNQFRNPDFARLKNIMKTPLIFDGRNLFDPAQMKQEGFAYFSIGRPNQV